MVIGGLAVSAWAAPRTTLDVDVTVHVPDVDVPAFVERLTGVFRVLVNDPVSFARARRVLPLETTTGGRIDLVFALLPFEEAAIARAKPCAFGDIEVPVCSPEDLIIHKVISERARDRDDVRSIITAQRDAIDRAYLDPIVAALASDLERSEIAEFYRSCWD